jgi:hypothetical protein
MRLRRLHPERVPGLMVKKRQPSFRKWRVPNSFAALIMPQYLLRSRQLNPRPMKGQNRNGMLRILECAILMPL